MTGIHPQARLINLGRQAVFRLALPGILVVGALFRLWDIDRPFIGTHAWNEVYYSYIARSFDSGNLLVQADLLSGGTALSAPIVPWLIYASFKVFGVSEWAARLPSFLCGMITLGVVFALTRNLYGSLVAYVATLLVSVAPGIVLFSRNAQPESAMVALGLGAVLTMVIAQRKSRWAYVLVSFALFALALLAKYTALLFWPALAWVWLDYGRSLGNKRKWAFLSVCTVLSVIPAVACVALMWSISTTGTQLAPPVEQVLFGKAPGSAADTSTRALRYFVRFKELQLGNLPFALFSVWGRLEAQLGAWTWLAGLFAGVWLLAIANPRAAAARYSLPMLLTVPWFLPVFLYPYSWLLNEYYTYPALYPICICWAVAFVATAKRFPGCQGLPRTGATLVIAISVGLFLFANLCQYRAVYRNSYYPRPLASQDDAFYSARLIAELNTAHQPVLADTPLTLYYSGANRSNGVSVWWWDNQDLLPAIIRTREFVYLVFVYPPPADEMEVILNSGYERIAPGAWRLNSADAGP